MDASLPKVGFIGAGRTGTALAVGLSAAGYPIVTIASREFASAQALAARLGGSRAVHSAQTVVDSSDIVFITTPDAAIRGLVASLRWRAGVAVIHASGVETRDALAVAAARGAATGSLHPLQTFASREVAGPQQLRGIVFAVEAEGDLKERLLTAVAALGGQAIELRAEDKALYHASAVMISNYSVTLAKLATDLWLRFGWDRQAALKALLPLLHGTVDNLERSGLPFALTGPVARGDVGTVRAHLEALSRSAPELLAAYKVLALETIPVALARGELSDSVAAELRALLEAAAQSKALEGTKRTR